MFRAHFLHTANRPLPPPPAFSEPQREGMVLLECQLGSNVAIFSYEVGLNTNAC